MSLPVLALVVVVGLALIIGVVHLSGGSRTGSPLTERLAKEWFQADLPNEMIASVLLSDDGRSALFTLEDQSRMGLIKTMGTMNVSRLLDGALLKQVVVDGDILRLKIADFTLRSVELKLADNQMRADALSRLQNLKETS